MIDRKDDFVIALQRMINEKGPGVYADASFLKNSLRDYATDTNELRIQRMIFANTMTTDTAGGFLYQEVRHINDFDAEKQKNWMRWLSEVGVLRENAAFTIVCLMESLGMGSYIDKSVSAILGIEKGEKPVRINKTQSVKSDIPRRHLKSSVRTGLVIVVVGLISAIVTAAIITSNNRADHSSAELTKAAESNNSSGIPASHSDKFYVNSNDGIEVAGSESAQPEAQEIPTEKNEQKQSAQELPEPTDTDENNTVQPQETEENKTYALNTLDVFANRCLKWRDSTYYEAYLTDNYGNKYDNVLMEEDTGGIYYIEYYIEKYNVSTLNFTTFINKAFMKYDANKRYLDSMYINIIGDEQILYTYKDFSRDMEPTNISVNIENVKILRIEIRGSQYIGFSNAYICN